MYVIKSRAFFRVKSFYFVEAAELRLRLKFYGVDAQNVSLRKLCASVC